MLLLLGGELEFGRASFEGVVIEFQGGVHRGRDVVDNPYKPHHPEHQDEQVIGCVLFKRLAFRKLAATSMTVLNS